jgi:phage terminase large subunit GpA-like protein
VTAVLCLPAPPVRRWRVPAVTREAVGKAVRAGLKPLRADPPQRFADWARDHFRLSADSSHKRGGWEPWSFQVGIMDAFDNVDIEQVDVMKAKRIGYTKMLTAYIGYAVAHRNRKVALWQPTDDDRDSFVKSEIEPMISEVPAVRAARRTTKGAEDTIKFKQFRAAVAHFLGGKAQRAYRRITVDDAILDEIDGFDQQIERSLDPVTGARGRLEGAPFPKLILGSTPRIKLLSHVEREAGQADAVLRYRVPCPHCGVDHPLVWGDDKVAHGMKFDGRDPKVAPATVRHVCPHCLQPMTQADYFRVEWQGAWVCDRTGLRYGHDRTWRDDRGQPAKAPRHVAFVDVWTAYSPQRTWSDIAREGLEAHDAYKKGNKGPLQGFKNETLAQTWEDEYEQTEAEVLRRRARAEGLPLGVVPAGACVVLVYVDVQADRWEYVAWAVGRESERWAIDYRVISGNTADVTEWQAKIEPLIGISYPHARGGRVAASALGVDTGYQTHIAYQFVRAHQHRGVYATKGDGEPGKPIRSKPRLMDVNVRGRVIRRGVKLWMVGTDTAKDLLHGQLQLEGSGPGRMHFASTLPDAFFDQLTAEQRVPVRGVRGLEFRWVCPTGRRNEVLDCTVGCMFLEEVVGCTGWTERQWQRLEATLAPDLFDAAEPAPVVLADGPAPPPASPPPTVHTRAPRPTPPPPPPVASDDWSSRL